MKKIYTTKRPGNDRVDLLTSSREVHHSSSTNVGKDAAFTEFDQRKLGVI